MSAIANDARPGLWGALLVVAVLALPPAALAEDEFGTEAPAAKRAEGRYFIELAEIMLTADQFTMAIGSFDDAGPGAGAPARDDVADLGRRSAEAPRTTIGLNRPSGTQLSFTVFDFDLEASRIPQNFDGTDDILTPYLLPPGVIFQRQGTQASGDPDDDYVPNWAVEHGWIRRIDYKELDFTMTRDLHVNKVVRLRWMSGLRYAQLSQDISLATAYAREFGRDEFGTTVFPFEVQDFAFLQSRVQTHGLGPKLGLALNLTPFKNKKWSFDASADVAALPESTVASYGVRFLDDSPEEQVIQFRNDLGQIVTFRFRGPEPPILPGLEIDPRPTQPFAALVRQTDFTDLTFHLTGQVGFRWQGSDFFTVGLDLWQMRWHGLIDQVGVLQTVAEGARYELHEGDPEARDPALTNDEGVLHLPRFTRREDYVIDGVSLNLTFQF